MANAKCQKANAKWPKRKGQCQVANDRWPMVNGQCQMDNGRQKWPTGKYALCTCVIIQRNGVLSLSSCFCLHASVPQPLRPHVSGSMSPASSSVSVSVSPAFPDLRLHVSRVFMCVCLRVSGVSMYPSSCLPRLHVSLSPCLRVSVSPVFPCLLRLHVCLSPCLRRFHVSVFMSPASPRVSVSVSPRVSMSPRLHVSRVFMSFSVSVSPAFPCLPRLHVCLSLCLCAKMSACLCLSLFPPTTCARAVYSLRPPCVPFRVLISHNPFFKRLRNIPSPFFFFLERLPPAKMANRKITRFVYMSLHKELRALLYL